MKQLERKHTLRYALVPHGGDWRAAGVYRDGQEFNNPLICRTVAPHAGSLPKRWGFVDVSPRNLVVSALKPGSGGTIILRVYEAAGQAATGVKLKLSASVMSARECNLMEDTGREVSTANDTIALDLGPFEIKTLSLDVKSAK